MLKSAFLFFILINFKHIFIYGGLGYALFYLLWIFNSLNNYVQAYSSQEKNLIFKNVFSDIFILIIGCLFVFTLSFGPFIYQNQLNQLLKRLFPFQRGLRHDYWASNFWAFYGLSDKILTFLGGSSSKKVSFSTTLDNQTRPGLSKLHKTHETLPEITPLITTYLVIITFVLPFYKKIFANIKPLFVRNDSRKYEKIIEGDNLILYFIWASSVSFYFGYHVHEKAGLMITLPFILYYFYTFVSWEPCITIKNKATFNRFYGYLTLSFILFNLSINFSLFPLLFTLQEEITKLLLFTIIILISLVLADTFIKNSKSCKLDLQLLMGQLQIHVLAVKLYFIGTILIYVTCFWIMPQLKIINNTFQFIPLMIVSIHGAMGVTGAIIYLFISISYKFTLDTMYNIL